MNQKTSHNGTVIVYIITKLELGGAQKVCLSLYKELYNRNMPTFLISGTEGPLVSEAQKIPYTILLPEITREVSLKACWAELKSFVALTKQLRSIKKQYPHLIVHTHSTKAGILGRWAALFAGAQQRIHTIHGYGFHQHQNKLAWLAIYLPELFTSLITTHFVCVSSYDAAIGKKLFPGFTKKHSLIRAAVKYSEFFIPATRIQETPPQFIFGTVACFKPQKNLFDLLSAFECVHAFYPHARLEIVGDGALRKPLEEWILQHKLSDAIKLHGWLLNVAPTMKTWNAFILSSLWEGLPCAIVEARLLKLPVICYNTGGISDIIIHGINGFLIEQRNWKSLAQHMATIITDKELYMSLQSYNDNLHEFEEKTMIDQHILLYNTYIEKNSSHKTKGQSHEI